MIRLFNCMLLISVNFVGNVLADLNFKYSLYMAQKKVHEMKIITD